MDIVRKRNPTRSIRALSRSMDIPELSMCNLVTAAGFKSLTKLVVHELMPGQQERRLERVNKLLDWLEVGVISLRNIVWTEEKNFVLQEHFNRRNNRILVPIVAHNPSVRLVKRCKNPSSFMVFGAMASNDAVMDPICMPAGMTISSATYQEHILPKLLTWMKREFGEPSRFRGQSGMGRAVLMQDGAPAHMSNSTQKYLVDNLGSNNFWNKSMWPPSSPDANPLDFSFWNALATAVTAGGNVPPNCQSMIRKLEDVWHEVLKPDYVRKTCQAA